MDKINAIDTATKLKDIIHIIGELKSAFTYIGAEKETIELNVK